MLSDKIYLIAQLGHEVTLWLLILLSLISVAFILERWFVLSKELKNSKKMAHSIEGILASGKLDEISRIKENEHAGVCSQGLEQGLKHIQSHGDRGLEEIFNSFSSIEKTKLEQRLGFLATVGSNAPFIGLLGTVFGIMDAFKELALSQGEASLVMLGISKALIATAIGLLVAIPSVVFYNYYQKTLKQILQYLSSTKDLCLAYGRSLKK